jgi:hypothetical protein
MEEQAGDLCMCVSRGEDCFYEESDEMIAGIMPCEMNFRVYPTDCSANGVNDGTCVDTANCPLFMSGERGLTFSVFSPRPDETGVLYPAYARVNMFSYVRDNKNNNNNKDGYQYNPITILDTDYFLKIQIPALGCPTKGAVEGAQSVDENVQIYEEQAQGGGGNNKDQLGTTTILKCNEINECNATVQISLIYGPTSDSRDILLGMDRLFLSVGAEAGGAGGGGLFTEINFFNPPNIGDRRGPFVFLGATTSDLQGHLTARVDPVRFCIPQLSHTAVGEYIFGVQYNQYANNKREQGDENVQANNKAGCKDVQDDSDVCESLVELVLAQRAAIYPDPYYYNGGNKRQYYNQNSQPGMCRDTSYDIVTEMGVCTAINRVCVQCRLMGYNGVYQAVKVKLIDFRATEDDNLVEMLNSVQDSIIYADGTGFVNTKNIYNQYGNGNNAGGNQYGNAGGNQYGNAGGNQYGYYGGNNAQSVEGAQKLSVETEGSKVGTTLVVICVVAGTLALIALSLVVVAVLRKRKGGENTPLVANTVETAAI